MTAAPGTRCRVSLRAGAEDSDPFAAAAAVASLSGIRRSMSVSNNRTTLDRQLSSAGLHVPGTRAQT